MYIAVNSENMFGIQKWKTLNNFLTALETLSDQVPLAKRILVWGGKYSKYVISELKPHSPKWIRIYSCIW